LKVWEDTFHSGNKFRPTDISWNSLMGRDHWAKTEPPLIKQGFSYSNIENLTVERSRATLAWLNVPGHIKHESRQEALARISTTYLTKAIPKCFYINLENRKDRKERVEMNMARVGLTFDRVPAFPAHATMDGIMLRTPDLACAASHILALKTFLCADLPYALILEDDAVWTPEHLHAVPGILQKIPDALRSHPMVLLSCSEKGYSLPETWLRGIRNCGLASPYIITKEYVPTLLKLWEDNLHAGEQFLPAHVSWVPLMERDHWAMTEPLLIQ